ncbi:hypothetical protein B0I26_10522 [Anoxybacillus vitaminiphilus]|uniref:Uncharacterized protein n=1 Tax=Paranoxybacillus vitaminiphilus TaxID=581036 RepID=A0A327YFN5_9BACL|nr:hypothetical protein [Anoxybacillus vitaminiphilus]RAK19840.1 hypothetical protein B0I26_10522 [Anoxybacillus vitaminiphilus]
MLKTYLPKYVLVQAAGQIKSELDTYENSQALIKKALLLYRIGTVYKIKVEDGSATALVLLNKKNIVRLQPNKPLFTKSLSKIRSHALKH